MKKQMVEMTMDDTIRLFEGIRRVGDRSIDQEFAYAMSNNRRLLSSTLDEFNKALAGCPKEAQEFSKAIQEAVQARIVQTSPVMTKEQAIALMQDPKGIQRDMQHAMDEWPNGKKLLEEFNASIATLRGKQIEPSLEIYVVPYSAAAGLPFSLVDDLFPMLVEPEEEPEPVPAAKMD